MATTPAGDGNNKLNIAQEVIVSAGNILTAAGFGRAEIAEFFRQAADVLAPPGPPAGPPAGTAVRPDARPAPAPAAPPAPAAGDHPAAMTAEEIRAGFVDIAPVRALVRMAVDPEVTAHLRAGSEAAAPHIDLALQMLPLVAEAQDWLRDTAAGAGLTIHPDRRQWLAEVLPEDRAGITGTLFLDDFEAAYRPCFDFVTALAAAVICENDEAALNQLLHGLVSCGVIVTYDLKNQLEAGVGKLADVAH